MFESSFSSLGEKVVLVSSSDENHSPENIIDGLVLLEYLITRLSSVIVEINTQ